MLFELTTQHERVNNWFLCDNIIEKVGEVGISEVFSLRHQVDTIFKNNQQENDCNVAVD